MSEVVKALKMVGEWLIEELKNAGVDVNNAEEVFNALHGADRCEFAKYLANATTVGCENCKKLGFELCEIECNVLCSECIKSSVCDGY